MAKFVSVASWTGVNGLVFAPGNEGDGRARRLRQRARLLGSCAFVAATLLMPGTPQAVVCTNIGAGGLVGDDNGVSSATACGQGATADSTGSTALGHDT